MALVTAILSRVGAEYGQYAAPISSFLLKILLDREGSMAMRVEALDGLRKLSKANREILSQANAGVTSFVKALLEDFDEDLNVKNGAVVSLRMSPHVVLNVLYGVLSGESQESRLETNAGKMLSFYLQHPLLAKGIDGIESAIEKGFVRDRTLLEDVLEDGDAPRGEVVRWLKKISGVSLDQATGAKIQAIVDAIKSDDIVQNGHLAANKRASPAPHSKNDGSDMEEGELVDAAKEASAALVDVDSIGSKGHLSRYTIAEDSQAYRKRRAAEGYCGAYCCC